MRIILSPAKQMVMNDDMIEEKGYPVFLDDAQVILEWLKEKSLEELTKLWGCNEKIAKQNFERIQSMDLKGRLSPALLSYDGIAYKYMAPTVFEMDMLSYVQEHLRILSGFYGVLKPMDGVTPYRLEMQAKAKIAGKKDLYDFWGSRLYEEVRDESGVIINLASKEYSKCIEKYLKPEDTYITCTFAEIDQKTGKQVSKGVYCKMARGEMVRFMAENRIENPEEMKKFHGFGYRFIEELSSKTEFVFLKE